MYYDEPTQVKYLDSDCLTRYGIAYQDFIIDSEIGEIFFIADVLEKSLMAADDTIIELSWMNLTGAIK